MSESASPGARERTDGRSRRATEGLVVLAALIVVGVVASTRTLWLPRPGPTPPPLTGVLSRTIEARGMEEASSGAYRALVAPDGAVVNVLMGALTFYLVATAWRAARRRDGRPGIVDAVALLVALAAASGLANYGLEAASTETLLAGLLDLRLIVRGGVFGADRVARHLWRMGAALFIAVTSLFLGQPQVFPRALRNAGVLVVPSVLVVILLVFWLVRVAFAGSRVRPTSSRSVLPFAREARST